ncbi:filamentous hemagglutinin family protein [Sphingomonas sp. PP-CE-3G-477]|uniref:two-partner secretion domain-containing protein n=1 Tax=Sphingomonas sp. PP-CE-3G-477 TaxID=2135660 RepID=UPI000D4E1FE2|nr:filamentous hemagglutinin N-terminal domain-containing protein [Sphingomonas sp. PP-CE-3G-477]PTQ65181.1 filamentous hemagglutinin family protein [Sphingomonas sp. PP-CE-3G-477]
MTHVTSPVRRRRLLLIVSSALGGIAALPAVAQTVPAPPVLPTRASVDSVQTNLLGSDPRITSPNGNLNVELRANNTVINWKGFNIPKDQAANFENGTASSNIAVLNRDISSNPSQLLGKLTSSAGVAVWVLNSNGIVVGPGANFTTGSLVLSTLDVTDTDFLDGGSNYRLSSGMNGAGSISAITVASGAQMTVEGGNRGLIMIAPRIEADGVFQAKGQDVAFVTATDVTLNYATNSPLSVTLNRGTAVPKNSQYVRGTVDGRDALFALASQGNITDALLQIDARVTTASNGRRGIVLSAGKPDTAVAGITVAGAAVDTGGIAGVSVSGVMSTQSDDNGDIIAGASGTASFARALTSGRDVILSAGGALTVAGDVTATRDYRIAAQGIALGSGTSAIQRAGRGVDLVSTNGNITGAAGLSLRSGGSAGLTLSTAGTAAGDILFDATSSISGGSDRSGYVDIRQRGPANQITLGNVAARGLRQAIGAGAIRNGLTTTSSLALGNIDVRDGLALDAAGISAGTLASDRGVAIVSNGALTTGAITAGSGPVALTGGGTTSVAGTITAIGSTVADITIVRDGAMTLQGLTATRDAQIDAVTGAVSIAGAVGLGRNYRVSGSGVTLGAPGAVTQRADGAITITAGAAGITGLEGLALRSDANGSGNDPLTLAVTAPSTTGIAFAPGTSLFGGTSRQSDVQLQLNDAASPISLGKVEARSLTGLSTTGALRSGDVNIVRDLTASGASIATGALTASSGAVTLTATGGALTIGAVDAGQGITLTGTDAIATGRLTARDAVTVNAVGAATFGSDVTAGGALTLRGSTLGFAGGNVRSGGSIDLLASTGGIVATGGVALASTSTRTSDFVRLQAAGVDGIVLASGSSITAGANRALRIGIFNAAADAPLSLGNVTARSLSALGAANADATVLGGAIVSGGSLTFGALDLVDGFAAESAGGNLSVGRLAVTGAGQGISLRAASGTLTVQNDVSASGDVTLVSGTALQLGTVESRDGQATLTSGGTVTLGTLAGRLGASASGTRIAIDTVRGGAVGLTASSGNVQVGRIDGAAVTATATGGAVTIRNALAATGAVNLTATGDVRVGGAITGAGVTVGAQGDTALLGGLQARGNVALSGRSVTLGGAQGATGSYTATSSAGAITGNAGTAIVADSDNLGGEALSLTATGGGITFDPATSLRGGNRTSAVSLTTDGGIITVGDVGATVFTAAGAGSIQTGNLTLTNSLGLSAAGGVITGAIATGDGTVTIDSLGGAVTTGAIDAGGGVSLAGDTVAFGTVRAASLNATAKVGTLTGGDITVNGVTALQTPGALAVGAIRAGNSVSLSGSTVRFDRVEASAFKATAGAALNGGDIVTRGDATLTAGDALAVGVVDADGIVALRGTTVNADRIDGASLTAVASKGALVAGDMLIGGPATIEATEGPINLGTVDSRGDLTITAGGRLFATGLVSGGTAALRTTGPGSDILLANGLVAENAVDVRAMGNVRAPVIRSRTGDLTIAAPNGELSGYDANGGVSLGAGPGKAFSLTIGTAARLGDVVGGKLTVTATSISAGRVDTGNEALELRATDGDLTLTGPASGGTVTLGASGRTQLAGVTSKGALTLTGGSIAFSDISGATVDATSAGVISGGSAAATGAFAIRGGAVTLNQVSAGTTLGLTATGGDLTLTGTVTGGDVTLGASGRTSLAKTTASGALILTGGSIAFSDIAGATIDVTSAGAITGGSATANGALAIRGGAVSLNQATAGTTLGLTATGGDLTLAGPVTGGDVTLGASGATSLAKTTASGALTLTGGSIAFSDISGATVDVTSAGAITGGSATAAGALGIRGGAVTLNQVSAGTTLGLTATGGDLTLTGPVTGGDVTLGASGRTSLAKTTARGALTLTGGGIAFSDISGGSIDATSAGGITGGSATATGALAIRGGTVNLGQANGGTTLGLTATNGDLTLTGLATGGTVTIGASGQTALTDVTAKGAMTLTGGTIAFANIVGASVGVTSPGAITGTSATATGALGVRGGTVTLDRAGAGAALALTATNGDLAVTGPVTGGDVTLGASGRTSLGKATATGALVLTGDSVGFADIAGASIDATSTGAITGTSATTTGALGVRGATVALGQIAAGGTATVAATGGDLALTGLTSGSDAILSATGVARISGAVTSGGAYRVTGGSVTLGDTGIVQKAAGEVSITATSGDLTGVRGLTLTSDSDGTGADRLVLDSAGQIAFAGTRIQARPGGGAVLGLRAGAGRAMQFGSIEASRIGSFDGNAIAATLSHNANIGADDIAVSDLSVALARGDLTFGKVGASGNLTLRTDAGAIALGEVRGGDIELASNGALTTANVTSTGGTSLKGETIDVRGRLSAARQLLADARAALTLRDVGAGGSATLKAGGAIVADTVEAASITASGAGVTLANAKAGDALTLTSGRDLSLGSGGAGGSATLDVAGLATIGALAAGPAVTVTANDVALNGPVRAQTVAFANRASATTTMRIGDGTSADGFRLSDAEVRQVTADTLRFDAGAGAMEVGTLALGTGSGRVVEMLGTGDIRVIGAVSTQGSGRSVRIGGGLAEGNANAIHVVATRDGGGRLLFDGSDVELRGTRIAIGLAPGFISTLQPGAAGIAQAQSLIGNGNSALYNPQLGGGFYDPGSTTTLSARSLTVRFGDYALFQNTAIPGEFSGLKLGGTQGAPVSPALRISTFGTPAQASVALFGTINGIDGASAALLGNPVINIDPVLLPNSRINGCLAGSGAGCINTIVIQPTLQVFDWSGEEVFGISRDVTVPFAPLVGSNNEELLTDLPALAPQSLTDQKAKP